MEIENLKKLAVNALEDLKAREIQVIDVRGKTSITDFMIIASGTSNRHVKALAGSVIERAKSSGIPPLGVEGERDGEWILVDLCDVVVHVMLPRIRDFYGLEKLWTIDSVATEKSINY